jgi:hypothetical protein
MTTFRPGHSAAVGQKKSFFEKQTEEVTENKGESPKNKPKQTGNKATELVENNRWAQKTNRKQTEKRSGPDC